MSHLPHSFPLWTKTLSGAVAAMLPWLLPQAPALWQRLTAWVMATLPRPRAGVRGGRRMLTAEAERMGMNLGPILRAQSEQRRNERFAHAEKLAMEAPVKLLFPLIAFIFPCTFVVLGFPIVMKFINIGL